MLLLIHTFRSLLFNLLTVSLLWGDLTRWNTSSERNFKNFFKHFTVFNIDDIKLYESNYFGAEISKTETTRLTRLKTESVEVAFVCIILNEYTKTKTVIQGEKKRRVKSLFGWDHGWKTDNGQVHLETSLPIMVNGHWSARATWCLSYLF